jgi:hypothetical protein
MPRDHYRQGLEEERSAEEVPRIYFLVPATEAAAKRKKPGYKARRRVGGKDPLLAEPISQTPGELREDQSQFRRAAHLGRSFDLLEADNCIFTDNFLTKLTPDDATGCRFETAIHCRPEGTVSLRWWGRPAELQPPNWQSFPEGTYR